MAIRVEADGDPVADAAMDAAFSAMLRVHAAMSFQSGDSDVAAINRASPGETIRLRPETRACLELAFELAEVSGGVFDPVFAGGSGLRDLRLTPAGAICVRALRLDLSGVAKGLAVDLAVDALQATGMRAGVVNAGGDLRVFGPSAETVALTPRDPAPPAAIEVADGALASSDVADAIARHGAPVHRDPRAGAPVAAGFAAVAAPTCAHADGLTKVVLAMGEAAGPVLRRFGARAWTHRSAEGWRAV